MTLRRLPLALLASLFASSAAQAQVTVTGTVMDSVSHRPLAGAMVQLESQPSRGARTTTTDSLGVYRVDSLPPGVYIIGFFDPKLDSLGIDLSPKRFTVTSSPAVQQVNLAIPPADKIESQLCRPTAKDSSGLILGHLRDAETGMPRQGTVTVLWWELTIGQGGIKRNRQQIPVKSNELGWFALCGLPSDVDLQATAQAGGQESGVIEVRVPAGSLLMRDFLVSKADSEVAQTDDSSAVKGVLPLPMLRRGSARVSGVVHNDKGKPVENADVSVPGTGLEGRTGDSGTFSLAGLPSGTQTVEVRAIGFEPKRVAVDLSKDRPKTLDVVLDRRVQTLDAVTVYGRGNAAMAAFQHRLKNGFGHILTPADIAKRNAIQTTDLLRTMPGVHVAPTRGFGNAILLRGGCLPTVYLNGMRMDDSAATEIDALAPPSEVTAIEVYNTAGRPAEFWGNNCGSVVLWVGMLPR